MESGKLNDLLENIKTTPWKRKAYTKTDVLVIDEASMLHPRLFDIFNALMKDLRDKRHLPFGGLQIIICGDFFQLPPVVKKSTLQCNPYVYERGSDAVQEPYLFDSSAWKELVEGNMKMIELSNVYRQDDPTFLEILDEMRTGQCSKRTWEVLRKYRGKMWPEDGILPTQISTTRSRAEHRNSVELNSLDSGPLKVYESIDYLKTDDGLATNEILISPPTIIETDCHFDSFQPDRSLLLKRNAQVILIRNLSIQDGLVNGAKGFIADFIDVYDPLFGRVMSLPLVQFTNGSQHVIGYVEFTAPFKFNDTHLVRRQVPLKLGWALTVHKSQGMTLDRVDIDIRRAFAPGHAYVAISRVKQLAGLNLINFSRSSVIPNNKVLTFHQSVFGQSG
jgi:ATP-dependent DNA helicase PIF1